MPPPDSDSLGVGVAIALDHSVAHLVVRIDLPAEELGVVAPQLVPVPSDDLEVDHRLSHAVSFPRRLTGASRADTAKTGARRRTHRPDPVRRSAWGSADGV